MSSKLRISFFGASVTQQKQSFAVKLKKLYVHSDIKIFGYGGMHLNNAGIIYIDEVLSQGCDICFIDWFSTDYVAEDNRTLNYLDTIIYKFTNANCKLVFLFLPFKEISNRLAFNEFCKNYLQKHKIYFLDLNEYLSYSPKILRDTVHTTNLGSSKYAEIIYNNVNIQDLTFPENTTITKYCFIKYISVNQIVTDKISLAGNAEILGFLLTVGPFSGIVKAINLDAEQLINTWDQWCYYKRKHFKIALNLKKNVTLFITNFSFDTSRSKVPMPFNKFSKKLIIHKIYYVGDAVMVNDNAFVQAKRKLKFYLRPKRIWTIIRENISKLKQ